MRAWMASGALSLLMGGGLASAQVVEVSAGSSTAFDAHGASVHLRAGNLDAEFGAGLSGGRFAAGGAATRTLRNGSITVGQQELRADVPTDVFDTRHTVFGTGVTVRRQSITGSLVMFTGFTSSQSGSPLFQAAQIGRFSHFSQWRSRPGGACDQVLTGMGGGSTVALVSVECSAGRGLKWAVTAGEGAGAGYAAGSAVLHLPELDVKAAYVLTSDHFQRSNDSFQPTPEPVRENISATWSATRSLRLSAAHGHWTMLSPDGSGQVEKSSMDSAGLGWEHRDFSVNLTAITSQFQGGGTDWQGLGSQSTKALTGALRYKMGRTVEVSEMLMHASGTSGVDTTIASTTVSVQPNARLRFSEGANITGQGISLSHGGSLLTRWSSFDVDYQFYYVAQRPDRPFQQGLLLHAELQLPGRFAASVASTISPSGAPLYTFQLKRVFSREGGQREESGGRMGVSLVRGCVQDVNGKPVARAALQIGQERVYTDDEGNFFWREAHAQTHPFRVLTEEFVSADKYTVAEAPVEVRSGEATPLKIVVRRELSEESAAIRP